MRNNSPVFSKKKNSQKTLKVDDNLLFSRGPADSPPFVFCSSGDGFRDLAEASNSSAAATMLAGLVKLRALADTRFRVAVQTMQDSDIEGRNGFLTQAVDQIRDLERYRQRVDDRTVTGPAMRDYLLLLVEKVYGLIVRP